MERGRMRGRKESENREGGRTDGENLFFSRMLFFA